MELVLTIAFSKSKRSEKVKEVRVDVPKSGIAGAFIPHLSGHSPLAERMAFPFDRLDTKAPQVDASVVNHGSVFGTPPTRQSVTAALAR